MRVLATTDTIGGVWTYTSELTEGLLAAGCHVSLVSFGRAPSASQQSWVRSTRALYGEQFRFTASTCPLEWMEENSSCYESSAPLLLDEISRFAPDLLHLSQYCYGALPVHFPKLVVAHSDVLSWHRAVYASEPSPSPWLATYRTLVQDGLAGADAVVAPTRSMLSALQQSFATPGLCVTIPNGRQLPASPSCERKLQACSVGRLWDPGKNAQLLQNISSPIPLLLAGETQHEGADYGRQLQTLGILDQPALQLLFASSAIYIATSLYEPFGLAPLEAALCGCALLLHDIPSLREVWDNAALYYRTAAELTSALNQLAHSPQLLRAMAQASASRARSLYTRQAMVSRYLALYTQLRHARPAERAHVA